jgi:hypothetical protein
MQGQLYHPEMVDLIKNDTGKSNDNIFNTSELNQNHLISERQINDGS